MSARWRSDEGAALVLVLSMVAVLSLIVLAASEAAMMSVRRTHNQEDLAQSRLYLNGAEVFAASRARDLIEQGPEAGVDQADWQGRALEFPLDDGAMRLTLRDATNCFNLNSMIAADEGGMVFPNITAQVQLARLIGLSGAQATGAMSLSAALTDWIDPDSVQSPGGAEDDGYGGADRPYRLANAPLADLADLSRVRGFSPTVVRALAPYTCTRTAGLATLINPNTLLPEQAILLTAIAGEGLPTAAAEALIRARPRGGWRSREAFLAEPAIIAANLSDTVRGQFTLSPVFVAMSAQVERTGLRETVLSLLDMRQDGRVVKRLYGAPSQETLL